MIWTNVTFESLQMQLHFEALKNEEFYLWTNIQPPSVVLNLSASKLLWLHAAMCSLGWRLWDGAAMSCSSMALHTGAKGVELTVNEYSLECTDFASPHHLPTGTGRSVGRHKALLTPCSGRGLSVRREVECTGKHSLIVYPDLPLLSLWGRWEASAPWDTRGPSTSLKHSVECPCVTGSASFWNISK